VLRKLAGAVVLAAIVVGVAVAAEAKKGADTAQVVVPEETSANAVAPERTADDMPAAGPSATSASRAYPPPERPGPATPPPRAEWVYAAASLDQIAAAALQQCIARGWASPETKVLHVRDWSAADAEALGNDPEMVLAGSPVDVAVTLEGRLVSMFAGSYGVPPRVSPYAVAFVDRASGSIYGMAFYDSLDQLPSEFKGAP
jgi:hypothetical protein